jgi:hypothetical protein
MLSKLFVIFVVTALAGCAFNTGESSGNQKLEKATQESLIKQFLPGVATKDDVAMQFGPPEKKMTAGSMEIWSYSYKSSAYVMISLVNVPTGEKKSADFYFDEKSGILKKIEFESHRG